MNLQPVMVELELRGEARVTGHERHPREVPARPVTYPQPAHHATMAMRLEGMPADWTARMLVLRKPDGTTEIYGPLVAYIREYPWRSGTWQNDVARALGLFWDYSRATGGGMAPPIRTEDERPFLQDLFRAFALALVTGTIKAGEDPSGLYWPASSRSVAQKMVRRIEEFARWCHDSASSRPDRDPTKPPGDGLTFTEVLVWSRMRNVRMLSHLSVTPRLVMRRSVVNLARSTRGHSLEAVKSFPRQHAERLIWEGHRRTGRTATSDICGGYNVRDQMMALLDGWGGLRRSEGLHLWVGDITEDPDNPGHALVVLHHPTEAKVELFDPLTRRMTMMTRAEALNRVFQLRARNAVTRTAYHVGWKGMELDRNHRAIIQWLDPRAANLFWLLYHTYLRFARKEAMQRRCALGGRDHPFLFVSAGEDRNPGGTGMVGAPYSAKAYERNHEAAVRRIGLPYGKEHGTTTHGLRHMYGRSLADLRLSPEIIRKAMRHVSVLSQLVYTAPDNATTDTRMREAWDRHQAVGPGPREHMAPTVRALDAVALGENTTQALLRLRAGIMGGGFDASV